jgi:hypothetical protein
VILLLVVFLFTQWSFVVVVNLSLLGLLLTFVCDFILLLIFSVCVISNLLAQDLVFYFNFLCEFFHCWWL